MIVYGILYEDGSLVSKSGWKSKDYSVGQYYNSYSKAKEDLKYRRSNGYCKVVPIEIKILEDDDGRFN